ncbi:PucR family transcriptional regulator [Clostridium felsineum]|uniref:PucR family transcriptional regulator n=1 Tax=Clostridium felsineum TaxID=36839 RepID=UPI00214D97B6|nr:PucR family transcriptional regulator [Clostridium felsineum]MCR3760051.1 PucR family transcriptional regulator [Clostridium felsineum]
MGILIDSIVEKLEQYNPKSYINNKKITLIESVKYIESSIEDFKPNTLYVGQISRLPVSKLILQPTNFLIVSKLHLPCSVRTNRNTNIVLINEEFSPAIFNKVLDIFFKYEDININSLKLLKVLSKNTGLQDIINSSSKILGNPMYVSNTNFEILSFTEGVKLNHSLWTDITIKGYQQYDKLQSLLKDTILNAKIPIYFKSINENNYEFKDDGNTIDELSKDSNSILYKENSKFTISRIWSNIYAGNKLLGQLIVIEAFKPFTERDVKIIGLLSNAISVELQKHKYYESSNVNSKELFLLQLLDGKITSQEALYENIKFAHWELKYPLSVISIVNKSTISYIQFSYIKTFFQKIFYDCVCVLYRGNIIIATTYKDNKTLYKKCFKELQESLNNFEMFCGVSRPFYNLLKINKYYKQSLKAIELGRYRDIDKCIFIYDSYILQHILLLSSSEESLKDFCHPAIFKLITYDSVYKTDYLKNLYLYVMNFKNQSKLAGLMHIHRNTLHYRISKIEEIMNVDLNNVDEFFSIYLSFKILEFSGEEF